MLFDDLIIKNPKGHCIARAGLSLSFYLNETLHTLAPNIADALDQFLALIGEDVLQTYFNDDGYCRKLTKRKLNQDRSQLQNVAVETKAVIMEYGSDPSGWVGEFGFTFNGADFSPYLFDDSRCNYLRLDFPYDYLEQIGIETFLNFYRTILAQLPVEFANGGFTFQRSSATQGDSTRAINQLVNRFIGIDPGYKDVMDDMQGHTFTAHWLNFIGPRITDTLRHNDQFTNALSNTETSSLNGGIIMRGAHYPPIGDINRGAPDLGQIPEIARAMKPSRADIEAFGEPIARFDGAAWLARFDERESLDWENEPYYKAIIK